MEAALDWRLLLFVCSDICQSDVFILIFANRRKNNSPITGKMACSAMSEVQMNQPILGLNIFLDNA